MHPSRDSATVPVRRGTVTDDGRGSTRLSSQTGRRVTVGSFSAHQQGVELVLTCTMKGAGNKPPKHFMDGVKKLDGVTVKEGVVRHGGIPLTFYAPYHRWCSQSLQNMVKRCL